MGTGRIIYYATFAFVIISFVQITEVNGAQEVPCFFIFGDSLTDPGNNNLRATVSKANYRPYGIDFPGGVPTGRFNNGLTTVDYIAKFLGFSDFIAPFATANRRDVILKGVNYGSGSSGIRRETGSNLGSVISLDNQLINHQITVLRIAIYLRSLRAAKQYLNKCIYYVAMGNNDYLNNYFLPGSATRRAFTPEQYAQVLINQYRGQLKRLYDSGARKIAIVGNGLIGCTPYAITRFGTNGSFCVDNLNNASQLFNDKIVALVDEFNSNFTDAKFIYINSVGIGSGDPTSVGFTVINAPCCPVGANGQCVQSSTPCANRREYVFWDNFHPTTAINNFTAIRSYTAILPTDTYPIDIKRLAQLQL